jgi:hypothetical protein
LRAGGGAGAAGSGSFSPETDRGNGGPGVVFAPDFKDVHEYWREDLNYLPTEHRHVITGVYAAGGASGAPGSFGGAGGGADAPSSDGHGITAHAPGCGGSGACKLSNSDSGIYMHGHGGDGVVIVRYAGPPKAEIRHPYGAYQEGNNVKNYTYYRAGYTYHVLAGAANLLWFGGTSATVGLLSPDGLNPVSVADENGVLNYKAYATGTAPKYNYGIWHNCLWQSSNAAQFALASGDATFKELAPKYFIHTGVNGEGDERRYSSDVLGSFFNVGFVIPSAQADDAAVVTRIALYGHVSSGAMRFEVYGVARGSAHAKELNDLGTPVLLASTQVTQSTGLFGVELPSLDTRTAFKKIWLKVIFGDGSNSTDDNIFVPGSNGFRVYGYPV